jgi:hypothetical protein
MREDECIQDFGGKARRKKTTRKIYTRRWEDDIKIDLRETEWSDMDWVHLAQDRD